MTSLTAPRSLECSRQWKVSNLLRLLGVKGKKNRRKRDNWFRQYQEIPQLGISGKRNAADRLGLYLTDDFSGASVLDIGCNQGQMCFQSKDWGATRVLGVEYDHAAYVQAIDFNKRLGHDVNFVFDDLDNPFFWNSIESFDVSLFLSVIDTKELENRFGILSKVAQKTNKVMYLEGHPGPDTDQNRYIRHILDYTDFTNIVYLGDTKDHHQRRVLIRCIRETMTSEECAEHIQQSQHQRIAVIGRGCAGKTHIRRLLESRGGLEGGVLIDDLSINRGAPDQIKLRVEDLKRIQKFVLFDYRALQYYDDFDAVYFVTPCESRLNDKHYPSDPDLRSPTGLQRSLKEVHTVVSKR